MFKKYLIILLLLIILPNALPTVAQTTDKVEYPCDLASLQAEIDAFVSTAGKLKAETDTATISNTLQEISNIANMARANCDELAFTGKGKKALGPFEVPKGTYRAVLTSPSDSYVGADITVVEGACGSGSVDYMSTLLFNTAGGEAKDGTETLFFSTGCKILVQLNIDNSQWDIKFERLTVS